MINPYLSQLFTSLYSGGLMPTPTITNPVQDNPIVRIFNNNPNFLERLQSYPHEVRILLVIGVGAFLLYSFTAGSRKPRS